MIEHDVSARTRGRMAVVRGGRPSGGSERGRVLPRAVCALTSSSSKDIGKE